MFDLQLEPWIVGDIATLAAVENDQESKVNTMVDKFYGQIVTIEKLETEMESQGIYYAYLPQWLKDRIDEIEIV